MVRVRFAPSPTGSIHVGSALTAVANRTYADRHDGVMALRIDDTDAARSDLAAVAGIESDLEWLGIVYDEGPIRQSERQELYRGAARDLLEGGFASEDDGAVRFGVGHRPTLLRPDGTATYHLASVVDDLDLQITHVIRGKDHLPNADLHQSLVRALGGSPPEYIHHGLLVGLDGKKLSKRHGAASIGDVRDQGIPAEAVRRYLEELDLPRGDVQFDVKRLRRLSVDVIEGLPDDELAARVDVPVALVPALRGARDLVEARTFADSILNRPEISEQTDSIETLVRFRELRERANGDLNEQQAREIVRELKAVGGNLRSLRVALTGAKQGPELWTVLFALPRDEALSRIDAAL